MYQDALASHMYLVLLLIDAFCISVPVARPCLLRPRCGYSCGNVTNLSRLIIYTDSPESSCSFRISLRLSPSYGSSISFSSSHKVLLLSQMYRFYPFLSPFFVNDIISYQLCQAIIYHLYMISCVRIYTSIM